MIDKLKACIDRQIECFRQTFSQELSIANSEELIRLSQPYPLFDPMTPTDIAYQYFNDQLDYGIKNTLLSGTLIELFQIAGFSIRKAGNACFGFWGLEGRLPSRIKVNFVFTDQSGKRIGVKFDTLNLEAVEREAWFERYGMDELYIIRAREKSSPMHPKNLPAFEVSEEVIGKISYHPIELFVTTYFGQEICDYYLRAIREVIAMVRNEHGFNVLPRMGQKQSYWMKQILEAAIRDVSSLESKGVDKHILDELNDRVFQQGCYQALMGQEEFARSFLTAEFLYHHMQNEVELDLTAIITGYMKSLEQFLYHLLQIRLKQGRNDLWVTSKKFNSGPNYRNRGSYKRVRLEKALEESFKTDLGALICFIDEDKESWLVSDELKKQIIERLQRFNKTYRNRYLHKDNLYDRIEVEAVRNEAFSLFYFLLGAYCVSNNAQSDLDNLGGIDYTYNRLYQVLTSLERGVFNFRIRFPDQEESVMCLRVRALDVFEYDEQGHILTPIEFVRTDKIIRRYLDEYEPLIYNGKTISYIRKLSSSNEYSTVLKGKTAENTIKIDKNQLPSHIEYYDEKQNKWISVNW